jgi:hypothetical protein
MTLKKNWLLPVLAVTIYFIHLSGWLTAYCFQDKESPTYGGFSLFTLKGDQGYSFDLAAYSAQIRANVLDGYALLQRDPFTYENPDKFFPSGNLIYALASLPLLVARNPNIPFLVCPLFSILLSLWFLKKIIGSKPEPLSTSGQNIIFALAACVLLLSNMPDILNLNNLRSIIEGKLFLPRNLGYIGRFPNIEFSIFLLLGWFYALTRFLNRGGLFDRLALGVSLAILQYCYFYWWTSAILFTGLAVLLTGRKKVCILADLCFVYGTYLVLALPFWIAFAHFNATAFGAEYGVRVGKEFGRYRESIRQIAAISGLLFVFDATICHREQKFTGRIEDMVRILRASSLQLILAATTFFFLNIQLLLGYTVQPYHWFETFYYPILIVVVAVSLRKFFTLVEQRESRYLSVTLKTIAFALVIVGIIAAGVNNYVFGKRWAPYLMFTKSERQLADFVARKLPSRSVIMSNNFNVMAILNATTSCKSFVPNGFLAYCSNEELLRRAAAGFAAMGYSKQQFKAELMKGTNWPAYLAAVKRLAYNDPLPSASTIPENYNSLVYIWHDTYYYRPSDEFMYPASLDHAIDSIWNQESASPQAYRLDYFVLYKKYLPPDFGGGGPLKDVLFENDAFVLWKAHQPPNSESAVKIADYAANELRTGFPKARSIQTVYLLIKP